MSPYLPNGVQRPSDPAYELEFVRGQGCYLWDSDEKRYLDFVSGYSSLSFGHSHPKLVAAATEQLNTLVHLVGWNHPWRMQLAESLAKIVPFHHPVKIWISTTGSRAVEIAWKIAVANRPGALVSFAYAYHGRSIATSQITHTEKLSIPLPNTIASNLESKDAPIQLPVLEYPRCEACPLGLNRQTCRAECFDSSDAWLHEHHENISAVIVEPALGARGYYYAANSFFQRLRSTTRALGILLIDDEVQMGMGRLGHLISATEQGWDPDLIVLGKSLGGGLVNVSAVLGTSKIMQRLPPGMESETFAADPLGCRIAHEALRLFDSEIKDNLPIITQALEAGILSLHQKLIALDHDLTLWTDCQGCSAVIEIQRSSNSSYSMPSAVAQEWVKRAQENGLLVHWSGKNRDRIVLIPPLIASTEQIDSAFAILFASYPFAEGIH